MGRKMQGKDAARVSAVELTFTEDHRPRQVLDRLLDDVVQHSHHGHGLFLAEPLGLEPLDEAEGVKMVITRSRGCGMECALRRFERRDVNAIVSDRTGERLFPGWAARSWSGGATGNGDGEVGIADGSGKGSGGLVTSGERVDLAVDRTPALGVVCRSFCECGTMRGSDAWPRGGAVPGQAREEAARDLCDMFLGRHSSVIWFIPYTMERKRLFSWFFRLVAICDAGSESDG